VVLIGVPIFAVIGTALGVFGYDASVADVRHRIRLAYGYLYVLLGSLYGYAIFAETIVQQLTMVVLSALVAAALWQKARDRLPYLLDAAAAPPARVSVSDGLIAALLFYVLQAITFLLQTAGRVAPALAIWIAFCVAGAVTFAIMRLIYRWSGTAGVPRFFDEGLGRALRLGLAGGIVAALIGFVYIRIVIATGAVPDAGDIGLMPDGAVALWLGAVAVLAAPVFEEFIFRGLLFGGLRRSFGPLAAVLASAAIFAIVHPPISMIPVFCMGVCAAFVYDRTRMLAAPIVVHAIYNALVIAAQWGPRWL
jgi:membrane protease YdiL (CAAX protease family)